MGGSRDSVCNLLIPLVADPPPHLDSKSAGATPQRCSARLAARRRRRLDSARQRGSSHREQSRYLLVFGPLLIYFDDRALSALWESMRLIDRMR